jgi:hypothetical protein
MRYLDELEKRWSANKTNDRLDKPKRRKSGFRGRELVDTLINFSAWTGDRRFLDAALALADNGMLNGNMNFARWRHPQLVKSDKEAERLSLMGVRFLMAAPRNMSLSRACAEVAAMTGIQAKTFAAARKRLELLYRKEPAA